MLDFSNTPQSLPNNCNIATYYRNFDHRHLHHCTDYNSCDSFRSYKKDSFGTLHVWPNTNSVDCYRCTMDLELVQRSEQELDLVMVLQLDHLLGLCLCHHNSFLSGRYSPWLFKFKNSYPTIIYLSRRTAINWKISTWKNFAKNLI